MKRTQIAKLIVTVCIVAIGGASVVSLVNTMRPSPGKKYEQLTMEEAEEFMRYEASYTLVDIGTVEEFAADHIEGAVNIPYETLTANAPALLPDKNQQIYICGRDRQTNEKAALKLVSMGYVAISEIGLVSEWEEMTEKEK